jgi:DNA polymerase III delta subunit
VKQYELDARLKNGAPLKATLFWGDPSMIDIYADRYLKTLPNDLSALKLYYDEFNFSAAFTHLSSPGLFNEGNLLVVRIDKKIESKNLTALLNAIGKNATSYMLFIYEADDAKAKLAYLKEEGFYAVVRFFAPKLEEAKRILKEAAAKIDAELNDAQAQHLLKINENNLSFAIADLGKIAVYDQTNSALIDLISAGHSDGDCYRLIETLVEKRQSFYPELERLFLQNATEMSVLLELIGAFRQLFMFSCAMRLGNDSKDFLGYFLPKDIDEARKKLASRFKPSRWVKILEALSELELSFKQTATQEKKALLYAFLIKLQTTLL